MVECCLGISSSLPALLSLSSPPLLSPLSQGRLAIGSESFSAVLHMRSWLYSQHCVGKRSATHLHAEHPAGAAFQEVSSVCVGAATVPGMLREVGQPRASRPFSGAIMFVLSSCVRKDFACPPMPLGPPAFSHFPKVHCVSGPS